MHILTFTTLYPNKNNPEHGVFVKSRLDATFKYFISDTKQNKLLKWDICVAIPYYPNWLIATKAYKKYQFFNQHAVEAQNNQDTSKPHFNINYTRFFIIPKIGMYLTIFFLKKKISLLFKQQKYDLIDGHYLYPEGIAISQFAKENKLPYILHARGSDVTNIARNHKHAKKLIINAINNSFQTICVNINLYDELISYGGLKEKLCVIRNGVDIKKFYKLKKQDVVISKTNYLQQQNLQHKVKIVTIIGKIIPRKNQIEVIKALTKIEENHIHLLMIGKKENHSYYKKLLQKLSLKQTKFSYNFIDNVDNNKLIAFYNISDLIIIPSFEEGWVNVYLEAAACGCKILLSNIAANQAVLKQVAVGETYSLGDVAYLAKKIKQTLFASQNKNIKEFNTSKWNWQQPALGYAKIIRQAVSSVK